MAYVNTACPHDCPSTCAIEVEKLSDKEIGRVRGASENTYTAGVICSKVARYAERAHHPERLMTPLRRNGPKGSGDFVPISWDDALDEVCESLIKTEQRAGSESVWPYYYAGTMGLVMRDGLNRLRHAKRYSGEHQTICVNLAFSGFLAGAGQMTGVDPREMEDSDAIVIWGTNAAVTQINVMTHALKARRQRNAKIVVVDTYKNATAKQADIFLCVRPGTDGALACAIMHQLFKEKLADWEYLDQFTDYPEELQKHLEDKGPKWASNICGIPEREIIDIAHLLGNTPKTFYRLGYGFTRHRNGASNMHAVASIPAVTGAWKYKGGGALMNNSGIYHWNKTLIEGLDVLDSSIRMLDQSRIGEILLSESSALQGGPSVNAMLIQNTNPLSVAPDLSKVHRGFLRNDLFTCVHEQFMTETAKMADIVLPATMFIEHDDLYQSGGHNHIIFGPKVIEQPGQCRSNHEVVCEIAKRLDVSHKGFSMTSREIIDWTLDKSGWGSLASLEQNKWIDAQPSFRKAHFLNGFAHKDKRWHFKADWKSLAKPKFVSKENIKGLPTLPDHHEIIETPNSTYPFRLVTAPARQFLNSTFSKCQTSLRREKEPTLLIHPTDAARLMLSERDKIRVFNERGSIHLFTKIFDELQEGTVIAESIWPNESFQEGLGINVLTGSDPAGPEGGAAFHDNRVAIETT